MRSRRWCWALSLTCVLALAGTAVPAAAQDDCLSCHGASAEALDAKLQVDDSKWAASAHGAAGISCDSCHAGKEEFPHQPSDPWKSCADCHSDAVEQFAGSVHGKTRQGEKPWPIDCQSCHGEVHTLPPSGDAASLIAPQRMAQTCGQCHANPKMLARTGVKIAQPLGAYTASVHARAVKEGKEAATCSTCHGSHAILPAADPASQVNRQRVPETCGQCHGKILEVFAESVHGRAAAQGIDESPVCTDCHGEHRILGTEEVGSPVYASNVPRMTCERCHADLRISEKFDLPADVVSSFRDSFHGLASRAGSLAVANCASCHGVHNILPSSDPKSQIHKTNLSKTCGNCHPGAGTRFAIGTVHVVPTELQNTAVYWIRRLYLWLIWLVIGGMVVHNLLDLRRKVLSPLQRPMIPVKQRPVRMSRGFRLAHGLMMVSFIVLAYSGFALTYPEAWWAAPLVRWEEQVALRGWVHRIAAVAMLVSLGVHVVHLLIDRRARACIRRMWPNREDVHEFMERMKWYLGRRKDMPPSGALGYAEKAEYLALIWGLVVMALTGFLLWFENFTLHWFPKWVTDVSTTIHFYEAVLASLAIVVWHFYFVMFDPLVYPMDTAWLNGREAPGRLLERKESTVPLPGEAPAPHPPAPEGE